MCPMILQMEFLIHFQFMFFLISFRANYFVISNEGLSMYPLIQIKLLFASFQQLIHIASSLFVPVTLPAFIYFQIALCIYINVVIVYYNIHRKKSISNISFK